MKFRCIFEGSDNRDLWAVCYPKDKKGKRSVDVFEKLFTLWKDTQYLRNFFKDNNDKLNTPYCNYVAIPDAIDKVLMERSSFIELLNSMENNESKYKLKDIFTPLHRGVFQLLSKNIRQKRAAPMITKPFLRIYAISLDDGSYVITGGGIKLTEQLEGEYFDKVLDDIRMIEQYLKSEGIYFKEGLTD